MTSRKLQEMDLSDLKRMAVRCQTSITLQKSNVWSAKSHDERDEAERTLEGTRDLARRVLAEIAHKEKLNRL